MSPRTLQREFALAHGRAPYGGIVGERIEAAKEIAGTGRPTGGSRRGQVWGLPSVRRRGDDEVRRILVGDLRAGMAPNEVQQHVEAAADPAELSTRPSST